MSAVTGQGIVFRPHLAVVTEEPLGDRAQNVNSTN